MLIQIVIVRAQENYIDRNGKISFFSEAPLENIEAHNSQGLSILDMTSGKVAISILMKGFKFEKALMQEHFNENYIESDKYPKATFTGAIKDFEKLDFSKPGNVVGYAVGDITIHGVTKPLVAEVNFQIENNEVKVRTKFNLGVADFDIDIPQMVVRNIAETVEVMADFTFSEF